MAKRPRQQHSGSAKKPVTIDLEAEHEEAPDAVATPADAASDTAATGPGFSEPADEPEMAAGTAPGAESSDEQATSPVNASPSGSRGSFRSSVIGGIAGAVLAFAGGGILQYAGVIPTPGAGSGDESARIDALGQRLDAIGSGSLTATDSQAREAAEAARQAAKEATDKITELAGRIDTMAPGSGGETVDVEAALAPLAARIEALEAEAAEMRQAIGTAAGATPDPQVAEKLTALEASVAELRARTTEAIEAAGKASETAAAAEGKVGAMNEAIEQREGQTRVAEAIAAAALKSAIDRGGPFMSELETYATVTGDEETVAALRTMAASGVPTASGLASGFGDTADAVLSATAGPGEDAGLVDRLLSSARGLVKVRPVGMVEGETPEAVLARVEAHVVAGDLQLALTEFETLPENARNAGSAFAANLRARIEADRLVREKLDAALAAARG